MLDTLEFFFWNEDNTHGPGSVHVDILALPVRQTEGNLVNVACGHADVIHQTAVVIIDHPTRRLINDNFSCNGGLSHRSHAVIVHPQRAVDKNGVVRHDIDMLLPYER